MTINLSASSLKRRRRDACRYAHDEYRVIGDGRNVTLRCFYYDGRRRIAGFYKINEKGQTYVEFGEVAVEFRKFRRLRLIAKS